MVLQTNSQVSLEEITDADELAAARTRREQFDRNWAWFQRHTAEIYEHHRGQCICIAGEELFAAETARDAAGQAAAAHPDEKGRFAHYIPREKAARI